MQLFAGTSVAHSLPGDLLHSRLAERDLSGWDERNEAAAVVCTSRWCTAVPKVAWWLVGMRTMAATASQECFVPHDT